MVDYYTGKDKDVLGMGFEGPYKDAEIFMMYVLDPKRILEKAMEGEEVKDINELDMLDHRPWPHHPFDVHSRILSFALINNSYNCFHSFLECCKKTAAFNVYFTSLDFFKDLYIGSYRFWWTNFEEDEKNEPYRQRLRELIAFCKEKYPNWEEKYLEGDDFFGPFDWKWMKMRRIR